MALYSMIQFASVLILYTNKTNLGDTQFLYIDLVITTTVAVLMGRTGPWHSLVQERPPGSLVSAATLLSVGLQILASLAGQVVAVVILHYQAWYSPVKLQWPDQVRLASAKSNAQRIFCFSVLTFTCNFRRSWWTMIPQ